MSWSARPKISSTCSVIEPEAERVERVPFLPPVAEREEGPGAGKAETDAMLVSPQPMRVNRVVNFILDEEGGSDYGPANSLSSERRGSNQAG